MLSTITYINTIYTLYIKGFLRQVFKKSKKYALFPGTDFLKLKKS